MTPDGELLCRYAEARDEAAFAELVRRHIDLVHSVALRQAQGDAQLAKDAVQLVFVDLARKAAPLSRHVTLAGWLHTSARFAANKLIRGEQRRRTREQEAAAMPETTDHAIDWEQMRPLLDEGVAQLNAADRDAVVLRFYQKRTHLEIGTAFGLSENSANKRVERALEKLRAYFSKRGVTTTAAALAGVISANSVQAAPAGLAERITSGALAAPAGMGVLAALFMFFSLMTMKMRILLVGALVAAIAAWMSLYRLGSVASPSVTLAGVVSAKAPVGPPASSAPKVETPAAGSVVVSAASATGTATVEAAKAIDPQSDLDNVISEMTTQLQGGDLFTVFKTFISPRMLKLMSPENLANMEKIINEALQDPESKAQMNLMINGLIALKSHTPTMNADGTQATYTLTPIPHDPSKPPTGAHPPLLSVRFDKIDGKWYISTVPVDLFQLDGKWHLATRIDPATGGISMREAN